MVLEGGEKNPEGQVGPTIHVPLKESLEGIEQTVQKDGDPRQLEQPESQAITK